VGDEVIVCPNRTRRNSAGWAIWHLKKLGEFRGICTKHYVKLTVENPPLSVDKHPFMGITSNSRYIVARDIGVDVPTIPKLAGREKSLYFQWFVHTSCTCPHWHRYHSRTWRTQTWSLICQSRVNKLSRTRVWLAPTYGHSTIVLRD
jgi:hypothetical protein